MSRLNEVLFGSAVIALLSSAVVLAQNNQTNITFQLSARNLPSMDPFDGAPDPYVIITYENPPNPPLKFGETSKLSNTHNPVWPEVFRVVHLNGTSQKLTLDLYDEDIDSDDYMGAVELLIGEITSSFGGTLARNITLNNSTMGEMIITANITNSV